MNQHKKIKSNAYKASPFLLFMLVSIIMFMHIAINIIMNIIL